MDLESPSVYVGIDIAKAHLNAAVGIDATPRRFVNEARGIDLIEHSADRSGTGAGRHGGDRRLTTATP